jgi:hypothetical protein
MEENHCAVRFLNSFLGASGALRASSLHAHAHAHARASQTMIGVTHAYTLLAAAALAQTWREDLAAPPAISVTNAIDGNAFFNITIGQPASACMCESPSCSGQLLLKGDIQTFRAAQRCNYYTVGGGITTKESGTLCYTFRLDYKGCQVYPSDAFVSSFSSSAAAGECARLNGATCTMRRSVEAAGQWMEYPVVTTLTGDVDRSCNTLPWKTCVDSSSICCGSGWSCRLTNPDDAVKPGGSQERICQPPHGPDWREATQVFDSWGAKGVDGVEISATDP